MISFLLHPQHRNPEHQDYQKAHVLTWIYVLVFILWLPYFLFYIHNSPDELIKILNESIWGIVFMAAVCLSRFSTNINYGLTLVVVISYLSMSVSAYFTGGIYSIELIWIILVLIIHCVFISYSWAIFSGVAVCAYIFILYYLEKQSIADANIFKSYVFTHTSDNQFVSLVLVIICLILIMTIFVKALKKTNEELLKLSENKIGDLENKLEQKTNQFSEMRSDYAKHFTDEMGNKLAGINALANTAALKLKQNHEQDVITLLDSICARSQLLFEGTKEFIWAIDIKSDYTKEIFEYLRTFAEKCLSSLEISFHAEYHNHGGYSGRLSPTSGHGIACICKEIITHLIQSPNCTDLGIVITEQAQNLEIKINYDCKNDPLITAETLVLFKEKMKPIEGFQILLATDQNNVISVMVPLETGF